MPWAPPLAAVGPSSTPPRCRRRLGLLLAPSPRTSPSWLPPLRRPPPSPSSLPRRTPLLGAARTAGGVAVAPPPVAGVASRATTRVGHHHRGAASASPPLAPHVPPKRRRRWPARFPAGGGRRASPPARTAPSSSGVHPPPQPVTRQCPPRRVRLTPPLRRRVASSCSGGAAPTRRNPSARRVIPLPRWCAAAAPPPPVPAAPPPAPAARRAARENRFARRERYPPTAAAAAAPRRQPRGRTVRAASATAAAATAAAATAAKRRRRGGGGVGCARRGARRGVGRRGSRVACQAGDGALGGRQWRYGPLWEARAEFKIGSSGVAIARARPLGMDRADPPPTRGLGASVATRAASGRPCRQLRRYQAAGGVQAAARLRDATGTRPVWRALGRAALLGGCAVDPHKVAVGTVRGAPCASGVASLVAARSQTLVAAGDGRRIAVAVVLIVVSLTLLCYARCDRRERAVRVRPRGSWKRGQWGGSGGRQRKRGGVGRVGQGGDMMAVRLRA